MAVGSEDCVIEAFQPEDMEAILAAYEAAQ